MLNGYEAIVIALGLYLIRSRRIERDGRTLLLIEAPFLVDLTFLVAEAGSVNFETGEIVNAIVLALAIVKTAIILRVLCGRWPRGGTMSFIVAELAVLFMMPTALRWFDRAGHVGAVHFYAAWWAVGLLLVGYEMQGRVFGSAKAPDEPRRDDDSAAVYGAADPLVDRASWDAALGVSGGFQQRRRRAGVAGRSHCPGAFGAISCWCACGLSDLRADLLPLMSINSSTSRCLAALS